MNARLKKRRGPRQMARSLRETNTGYSITIVHAHARMFNKWPKKSGNTIVSLGKLTLHRHLSWGLHRYSCQTPDTPVCRINQISNFARFQSVSNPHGIRGPIHINFQGCLSPSLWAQVCNLGINLGRSDHQIDQ